MAEFVAGFGRGSGEIPHAIARPLFAVAQIATERRHGSIRRRLLASDEGLEDMLAFAGRSG